MPVKVGNTSVLCMKSELHLNQDGVKTGEGTATLPVKDFFKQIIDEVQPKVVLTIGTAGSVFDDFELGDVVITRAAKFRLQNEFRNESWNGETFKSDWQIPTDQLVAAQQLMKQIEPDLAEPPFAPPTKRFTQQRAGCAATDKPDIKLGRAAGTARVPPDPDDRLLRAGRPPTGSTTRAAVEMGDAALGLACSEPAFPAALGRRAQHERSGHQRRPSGQAVPTSTSRRPGPSATTPPTASKCRRAAPSPPGRSSRGSPPH
jgi:hypothetical protein